MIGPVGAYRLHGMTMASPWPLSAPRVGDPADFEIHFAGERDTTRPIDAALLADARLRVGRSAAYADWPGEGTVTLRFTEVAEFEIDEQDGSIHAWVHPGADERMLPILLDGNVPAFILGLRGEPVLHAAATTFGARSALAIAGTAGQGKTTTAAILCSEGAALITDDTLRLDLGDQVLVTPGTTSLRLRSGAAEVVSWLEGGTTETAADGRTCVKLESAAADPLPLGAIVVPAPDHDSDRVVIERIRAGEAARVLLAAARVASWVDSARLRDHLDLVTRLASSVPAYRARIPWGPPFRRSAAKELAGALRQVENRSS